MPSENSPALLALDWGTSSLRAWLLAGPTRALETRSAPWGIMHLPAGGFEAALQTLCGDWLQEHAALPVIASGMVGSAQGWTEVPYVTTQAAPATLAAGLRYVAGPGGRTIAIVPGVLQDTAPANVMRGEETQLVGALALDAGTASAQPGRLFVLPGTHSKWVHVEQGRIVRFTTAMTGELYAVLRQHSILGKLMKSSEQFEHEAFEQGLDGAARGDGLLSSLFSVRVLGLTRQLAPAQVGDYLSGMLIGHEIREAQQAFSSSLVPERPLPLVGSQELCRRYALALARYGLKGDEKDYSGATQTGLWRIACSAGLIGEYDAG